MEAVCTETDVLTVQGTIVLTCRLCANNSNRTVDIFGDEGATNDLAAKINLYLPVKVTENDTLPLHCCWSCTTTLVSWHEFYSLTLEADKRLKDILFVNDKDVQDTQPPDEDDFEDDPEFSADISDDKNETVEDSVIVKAKTKSSLIDSLQKDEEIEVTEEENLGKSDENTAKTPRSRKKRTDVELRFFCDICKKGYLRKYDMQKHRKLKHADDASEPHDPLRIKTKDLTARCRIIEGSLRYFKCDVCGRIFKHGYHLARHYDIHNDVRLFCCHVCGKGFRVSSGLRRHVDAIHNGVRNYTCETCGRAFKSKAARDDHMNIHTDSRPYVCDVCGKAFRQKASLFTHNLFHTNDFRFECDICGKKFRRARELKEHGWLHSGHKPLRCEFCGSSFRLHNELKRHMKTHR